jgi:hypothetical protein
MAGKDTAKTEEDNAVRTLEHLVRRLRYRTEEDADGARVAGNEAIESLEVLGPTANNESPSAPEAVGTAIIDAAENLGPSEPLSRSIQNSLIRCRRLLDQLSDICGKAPDPEGSETGPNR